MRAVEQLPPQELAGLLVLLLERARGTARGEPVPGAGGDGHSIQIQPAEQNPYLAAAGMFADDSFAAEIDAYITAQREREREEAARAADA